MNLRGILFQKDEFFKKKACNYIDEFIQLINYYIYNFPFKFHVV